MLALLIIIESISVVVMLTQFARNVFNGAYEGTTAAYAPGDRVSIGDAFLGYVFMGLVPPVALVFYLGKHLSDRDKKRLGKYL